MKLFCGGIKKNPCNSSVDPGAKNISPLIIKQIHQFVSLMFHSCGRNIHDLKSRVLKCLSASHHGGAMDAETGPQNLAFLRLQKVWEEQRQRLTAPIYGAKGFLSTEVGGVFSWFCFWKNRHGKTFSPLQKKHICHDSRATKYGFCMGLVWVGEDWPNEAALFFKNKKIIAA